MQPIQVPITGTEEISDTTQPTSALVQFYRAFNTRDLRMMAENWEQSEDIAMDNPLGGIKRGWQEIKAVYEHLFSGSAKVYVEYHDYTIHQASEIFYVVGRERGYFRLGEHEVKLAIRTSRIFKKIDGAWKQVHHHGSIDAPELLARYQAAVLGTTSQSAVANPWIAGSV
jgi:ketosteroid isomerase-like protein